MLRINLLFLVKYTKKLKHAVAFHARFSYFYRNATIFSLLNVNFTKLAFLLTFYFAFQSFFFTFDQDHICRSECLAVGQNTPDRRMAWNQFLIAALYLLAALYYFDSGSLETHFSFLCLPFLVAIVDLVLKKIKEKSVKLNTEG